MAPKMTWEEIKTRYPDQWVSLIDVDHGQDGDVESGAVVMAGPDLKSVIEKTEGGCFTSHQFKYTGTVKNFLGFAKWDLENAAPC